MQQPKQINRFVAGMNKDVNPSMQPENTYRDALNMDISLQGEQLVLNRMKSVLEATGTGASWITGDAGNAYDARIIGRATGIGNFTVGNIERDCVVFFAYGAGADGLGVKEYSKIFVHYEGKILTVGTATFDAAFGSDCVVAFITRDRGRSFVHYTDGVTPLKRFELNQNVFSTIATVDEISLVRQFVSDNSIDTDITENGNLSAGTYQFAYRLKQSTIGSFTKWSLFTNPVAIFPKSTPQIGGTVGDITDKAVSLSITISADENAIFNSLELAVIKNNTGDRITQDVAFISTHTVSPLEPLVTILYDGNNQEYELPVTEITVDDAPVESAVAGYETNGRAIFGNIQYFDRNLTALEGQLTTAQTITEEVDYTVAANTEDKKGHYRNEVYRFGIAYHDRFGNFSPVKPFDFSELKRTALSGVTRDITALTQPQTFNASGSTVYTSNRFNIEISETLDGVFFVGDVVMINFGTLADPDLRYYDVYDMLSVEDGVLVCSSYEPLPTLFPTIAVVSKCIGNSYSHSAGTDWKFPSRDKFGYNVKGDNFGKALGLSITIDGTTHPSWATGFAIVRMERDRNVVYQTPLVPATNRAGVITPGKNTTNNKDYARDSNGIGEFDHLAPKIFQLGTARNIGVTGVLASSLNTNNPPLSFEIPEWDRVIDKTQKWDSVFAPAVDFVANAAGRPLVSIPADAELDISIVDLVGLIRVTEELALGVKSYVANNKNLYFHNGTESNYKIQRFITPSAFVFQPIAYPRIQDSIACFDQRSGETVFSINDLATTSVTPVLQSSEATVLPVIARSSANGLAVRVGTGSALVTQQRTSTTSIGAEELPLFDGLVDTQRGLIIGLNLGFLDPIGELARRFNSTTKPIEIPWAAYDKDLPPTLYTDAQLEVDSIRGSGNYRVGFVDSMDEANISAGNIANSVYVANIELGKSDFRYGGINRSAEFIYTGAYHKIVDTADVTLTVWGGDCFISKFVYKVNDNTCIPRVYRPIVNGSDITFGGSTTSGKERVAKTGVSTNQPEYITLWMESDANFQVISDRNKFPFVRRSISDFTAVPRYDYNFGYSIDNTAKKFFSRDTSIEFIKQYPARIIFSDPRVSNSSEDGYSRFRALNFKDLEEKYAGISNFGETQDGTILSTQRFAIRVLPIAKSIIQDEDGTTLALQSGEFISESINYVTTNYGSSNPNLTLNTENGVYVLDETSGALMRIASGSTLLQVGKMEGYFNEYFSNVKYDGGLPPPSWMQISYDKFNKELHIIGYVPPILDDPFPYVNWLTYNEKLQSFVTRLDYLPSFGTKTTNRPFYIVTIGGRVLLLHTQHVQNFFSGTINSILAKVASWKGGSTYGTLLIGGSNVNSEIEYICNAEVDVPKTFDIVGSNSFNPFTSYEVTAFNDGGVSETTGVQTGLIQVRDGVTHAPFVRSTAVGGGRLRGVYASIKMVFSNTTTATRIYSLFTQFRKSFR